MALLLPFGTQLLDGNGDPVAGGALTVYENGTTTPVSIYSDADLETELANPLTLDSAGRPSTNVYVAELTRVTVKVETSAGATVIPARDDVIPVSESLGAAAVTYTPSLAGALATTMQAAIGALPMFPVTSWAVLSTGTAAARRAAMQAAIDACAGVARLYIPPGTWLVDEALQWRAGSHIFGAGIDLTIIKLDDTAHEDVNVLEPVAKDGTVINWSLQCFTVDGNYTRGTVSGVGSQRPGSSGIATMGASHGRIVDVKAKDCVLHGIDICNGGEVDGSDDRHYVLSGNEAIDYYPDNESQYIFIDRVWAEDCGDDGISGHYAKDIFIGAAYASSTGGRHTTTTAPNPFEIDDGCRRWFVEKVVVEGGNRGVAVKTHTPQPTPQDVQIGAIYATGCRTGAFIDGAGTTNPGTGVQIGSLTVRNPAAVNGDSTPASDVPFRALDMQDCRYCTVDQVIAIAVGDESFDLGEAVSIDTNSEHISIGRILAVNWPYNNADDSTLGAVRITSSCSDIQIGQINLKDCGFRGVLDSGADRTILGAVNTRLTSAITSSVGIRFAVALATAGSTVSAAANDGYATATSYG